jgi:hypothetical protein
LAVFGLISLPSRVSESQNETCRLRGGGKREIIDYGKENRKTTHDTHPIPPIKLRRKSNFPLPL